MPGAVVSAGKVDVLAVMQRASLRIAELAGGHKTATEAELQEARAAVAELIEADRKARSETIKLLAEIVNLPTRERIGNRELPVDVEVIDRDPVMRHVLRIRKAWDEQAAVLARIGGAP